MKREQLQKIAYREAGALLRADADDADLQCEDWLSEKDASYVREFIRNEISTALTNLGNEK